MSETTIDSLAIQINSDAGSAVSGIDALTTSLTALKKAVSGGLGLRAVANQMSSIQKSAASLADTSHKISGLATALGKLQSLGNIKLSSSIANQLTKISTAAETLNGVNFSGVQRLANSLSPLTALGKCNLSSFITQLGKLPQLEQALKGIDWKSFAEQIKQLSDSLTPLASKLNTVSSAFSRMPTNLKKTVSATESLVTANKAAKLSYIDLYAAVSMTVTALRSVGSKVANWINEANNYIESLNLFTVSMGRFANEATEYADIVANSMGLDPAVWMRNQGVFNVIIKGFGVVEDKANLMSKNLVQLGYDISSFFNISVEDAMQKLTSGISGELEPLRRLGYDLSVARLQQDALRLGIDKSVESMTQAEKAQLRYWEILTQVTQSQGDMARTLQAPANQLRLLKAQLVMTSRALGEIFIPMLELALPYLIAFAKAVRLVANEISKLTGFKMPEIDYSTVNQDTTDLFETVNDTSGALEEATKNAKKFKKSVMGFDELNLLTDNSSLAEALDELANGNGDLAIDLPTYDFLGGDITGGNDDIAKRIKDMFDEVGALLIGMGLIVTGLIMVAFGHPFLGAALIIAGAATLYAAEQFSPGIIKGQLANMFESVTGLFVGIALVSIGLLIMAAGHPFLGTALIVAGAATVFKTATLNPGILDSKIGEILSGVAWFTGMGLMVIGILLLGTIWLPLGVALIAAGAALMITGAVLNVTQLNGTISSMFAQVLVFTAIGEIVIGLTLMAFGHVGLGAALILMGTVQIVTALVENPAAAIGAIASFFGAIGKFVGLPLVILGVLVTVFGNPFLGVAMIAAGFASLITAVVLNWSSVTGWIQSMLQETSALAWGSMVALGLLVLLTGNLPLGLALVVAGAAGAIAGLALNWSELDSNTKGMLKSIGTAVGIFAVGLGLILCLTGAGVGLGIPLILTGATALVAPLALNWSGLDSSTKEMLTGIGTVAGVLAVGLGIILCLTGVGVGLGLALIAMGATSIVSGLQPEWSSLDSSTKDMLRTIGTVVGVVAFGAGLILCLTGVGIPLGIALMAMGATALVTPTPPNFNDIVGKIRDFFSAVSGFFTGLALVALGVLLLGTVVGIPLGMALIADGIGAIKQPTSFDLGNLKKLGGDAIDSVRSGVSDAWQRFSPFWSGLFKNAIEGVKTIFGSHGGSSTVFQWIGQTLLSGLGNGTSGIGSVLNSIFSTIGSSLGGFGRNMFQWGSEMMGNLVTGINNGLSNLAAKVASAAGTIRSYLHFSQPDIGPLADFNSWMPDMMSQLAGGIADKQHLVREQMVKLASNMSLESTVRANVAASGATPAADSVGDNVSGLINAVYSAVSSALAAVQNDDGSETPIIINLGNEQLASYMVKQNKRIALISGGKS